jgi:outer membrane protein assembly factor BamB
MYSFAKKHPEVAKALVGLDTWRCMGSHDQMWIGEVFATPVTDGKAVYVATAWGVYASYDLDGNLRWMKAASPQRPHDYCAVARSPLLWRNLMISDLGRMVRAFDRDTGEMKWEHRREGGVHEFVSPVVMRVGDQDILWCAGPAAHTLPDGKPLTIDGWKNNGLMVCVNRDKPDTLFLIGGGEHGGWEGKGNCDDPPPAAVRFSLDGQTLRAKVLWSCVNGVSRGGASGMIYHNGRLYLSSGGSIIDAQTGIVLKGLFGGAVPASGHQLAIAGGHVYGLTNAGVKGGQPAGVMQVHDLEGRPVATNSLLVTPLAQLDTDNRTKRLSQWYSWPNAKNKEWCFTYSASFNIAADRIFIRSLDHLYCIASKGAGPATDAAGQVESLVKAGEWEKLAALGPAAKAASGLVEAQLAKAREPWRLIACLAAIDPPRAVAHRNVLIQTIVASKLSDHVMPRLGNVLYELGPLPREQLLPIEEAVDRRMYPHGGPKTAQLLLNAFYRRSGEVGFTHAYYHPLPWEGATERGKDITLSWSTINATKVRIEPGIGQVAPSGEHKVRLDQTTTYTFTAEGPGGPTVRKITVTLKTP